MKPKQIECPNCNAKLDLIGEEKELVCKYCGSSFLLEPDEMDGNSQEKTGENDYSLKCPRCQSKNYKIQREKVGTHYSGRTNRGHVRVGHFGVSSGGGKGSSQNFYRTIAICKECGCTWNPNDGNKSGLGIGWKVLLWICFFPIMISIWLWKTEKIADKRVKIGLIVALWIVCIIIWACSNPTSETLSENDNNEMVKQQIDANDISSDKETVTLKDGELVDAFISKFNELSDTDITDVEQIEITQESGNYRSEYRLPAFKNAVVKRGNIGDGTIDIVAYGGLGNTDLRCYVSTDSEDFAAEVFTVVAKMMYPDVTETDMDKALEELRTRDNGAYLDELSFYYIHSYKELFMDKITFQN